MTVKAIGITGGVGSGKSEVRRILSRIAYPCVDADVLAARVLDDPQEIEGLVQIFGSSILNESGRIDRGSLRKLVFSSDERRSALEAFMHPRIESAFQSWKQSFQDAHLGTDLWLFYEAALLIEKNRMSAFDKIILVSSDEASRLERLERRGLDHATARSVMAAQWDDERKRHSADYVLTNNGSLQDLKNLVFQMLLWLGDQFAASQT